MLNNVSKVTQLGCCRASILPDSRAQELTDFIMTNLKSGHHLYFLDQFNCLILYFCFILLQPLATLLDTGSRPLMLRQLWNCLNWSPHLQFYPSKLWTCDRSSFKKNSAGFPLSTLKSKLINIAKRPPLQSSPAICLHGTTSHLQT